MPFAAALSTEASTARAATEVTTQLRTQLTGPTDLAIVFFSFHHASETTDLLKTLQVELQPRCLLGCIAESVIGNDREIEMKPALSVWLAQWKEPVTATSFHLSMEQTSEGFSLMGWPDVLVDTPTRDAAILLLGDPYTFPVDVFLGQINDDLEGLPVVGGMASGFRGAGSCRLLLNDRVETGGAIGVVLQGNIGLRTVVSQGCKPIGKPLVITKAEEDIILELGGKPPLELLRELWPTLSPIEQQQFQQGLHIGRVLNEYQGEFHRGDFLVRNVMGLDRTTGALRLTDRVRVGQTVQFHVRDSDSADEDLHLLLQHDRQKNTKQPQGALLFSCNGRGSRMFEQPDHDARIIRQEMGSIPLAGFFAQGELGPVGGKNFIHGFTASVALFEE